MWCTSTSTGARWSVAPREAGEVLQLILPLTNARPCADEAKIQRQHAWSQVVAGLIMTVHEERYTLNDKAQPQIESDACGHMLLAGI
jgi:hypothetical protein